MRWLRTCSALLGLVLSLWLATTAHTPAQTDACVSSYLSGDYLAAVAQCAGERGMTPEYRGAALLALAERTTGDESTDFYRQAVVTLETYIDAKQAGAGSTVGAAGSWRTSTLTENLGGSLFNLAVAFDGLGDLDNAVRYYEQAATVLEQCLVLDSQDRICQVQQELVGGFERVRKNLGIARLAMGDPEAALSEFQRATALNSAFGDGYYLTGVSQTQLSAYDAALESYDRSLSPGVEFRFPERGYNGQGVAHIMQGDLSVARQDLNQALAVSDNAYATAFSNRGIVNFDLGDLGDSVTDYERYTNLRPDDPDGFTDLGYVNFTIGTEELALSHSPNLIASLSKLTPNRRAFYEGQLLAHSPKRFNGASLGKGDRATLRIAQEALAQASREALSKAGKAYEEALAIAPKNPAATYGLASVRRNEGAFTQALELFKDAVERYREAGKPLWERFTKELDIPALEARLVSPPAPADLAPAPEAVIARDGFNFFSEAVVAAYDAGDETKMLDLARSASEPLTRREAVHALRLKQYRPAYPGLQQRLSQDGGSYLEADQGVRASIMYYLEQVPPPPPPAPTVTVPVVSRPAPPPPTTVASTAVQLVSAPVTQQLATPVLEPPTPVAQAGCGTGDLISQAVCRFRT